MKAFTVWKFKGVTFLAHINTSNNVSIMDEDGNNYGGWMVLEGFRKRQSLGEEIPPLGKTRIEFRITL